MSFDERGYDAVLAGVVDVLWPELVDQTAEHYVAYQVEREGSHWWWHFVLLSLFELSDKWKKYLKQVCDHNDDIEQYLYK